MYADYGDMVLPLFIYVTEIKMGQQFHFCRTRKCNNPEPNGIGYTCQGTVQEVTPCKQEEPCGKIYSHSMIFFTLNNN